MKGRVVLRPLNREWRPWAESLMQQGRPKTIPEPASKLEAFWRKMQGNAPYSVKRASFISWNWSGTAI
ncbi:MAG: hypothetical protein PHO50_02135 [Aminobacterium colombiense]|jgi:hypothetical protein|nr:hypothetical protein [Aminobacterium colombiense]MDD3767597.1 hypothetical protein [Aminobacterium colombiense]